MKKFSSAFLMLPAIFIGFALIWVLISYISFENQEISHQKTEKLYRNLTPIIVVDDVLETTKFYEEAFGFRLKEFKGTDINPESAILQADSIKLEIHKSTHSKDTLKQSNQRFFKLHFEVSSIDSIYLTAKNKCEYISEIKLNERGEKEFIAEDNNSISIIFTER